VLYLPIRHGVSYGGPIHTDVVVLAEVSAIGGKGVRRSWRWQLPRVRLSGPSGFGAASGAAFRHGSRKRFLRR
jgi:hypothetical protein